MKNYRIKLVLKEEDCEDLFYFRVFIIDFERCWDFDCVLSVEKED